MFYVTVLVYANNYIKTEHFDNVHDAALFYLGVKFSTTMGIIECSSAILYFLDRNPSLYIPKNHKVI